MNRRSQLRIAAVLLALVAVRGAAAESRVIEITGTDAMQYSVKRIEAKPGESLTIRLTTISKMAKTEMAHNFVVLAAGANADSFAMAGSMARKTDYIPEAKRDQILANSALAGGGETVEVTFTAPAEPGDYTYLCTFPGHYVAGMKGILAVQ